MKTEPDVFSFDDLVKAKKRTTPWEGVRNYQARNFMRDHMKVGHQVLVYHSSCEVPGIVGLGEVAREAYPDKSALDPTSEYYDEKAVKDPSRWVHVDVKGTARLTKPISLAELREIKGLEAMLVLRRGMRLSIQPVTDAEMKIILKLGKPEAL